LTSAYSDMTVAIDAYTVANVSQYVTKPWNIEKLRKTLHCTPSALVGQFKVIV